MKIFNYQPPAVPWLDIRHIDTHIIVVNKPSGLLSNPGMAAHTHDCLLTRLRRLYPETILVHRLDCDTSGIMVFARGKKAESDLKTQFQNKLTEKEYIAEIDGSPVKQSGAVNLSLGKDEHNPPLQKPRKDGRKAVTRYRVLEQRKDHCVIELRPETGRTHQLRVHMLALGHPILGDDFYAGETVKSKRKRLSLHAQKLVFSHPATREKMTFISKHPF